jgi:hypothetical protein
LKRRSGCSCSATGAHNRRGTVSSEFLSAPEYLAIPLGPPTMKAIVKAMVGVEEAEPPNQNAPPNAIYGPTQRLGSDAELPLGRESARVRQCRSASHAFSAWRLRQPNANCSRDSTPLRDYLASTWDCVPW